ncbi:MAG: tetraacyldisaccharide 4'-kinase [Bacteroidales bacterium]|nr:tetraacyldisaccharide 4'-kinase [Bacteroidales bacterium]
MLYRLVVYVRNMLFDLKVLPSESFELPVIAVGNITAGGTGKTPHVEYLAGLLHDRYRIALLSRGYGRRTKGFLPVSPGSEVAEVGDEPLQIKRKFPSVDVAVDRRRVSGIRKLTDVSPRIEAVILDDAYQHRYVTPRLSILLIDYNRPVFHDLLLPAGNLREPWKNVARADIIIITKCPEKLNSIDKARFISRLIRRSDQEIFFTRYAYGAPVPVFPGKKNKQKPLNYKSLRKADPGVLLVTAIADPGPLRSHLHGFVDVAGERSYTDHHRFSYRDLEEISMRYNNIRKKTKYIFVTEKDAVRLRELRIGDKRLRKAFYYIPVEVKFLSKGEKRFIRRIIKSLK